jgi:hypothetical protein
MAWTDFAFTPADGVENTTTYESKPASGARAREQVQAGMNQIKNFINSTVKENSLNTLRYYMGVKFQG